MISFSKHKSLKSYSFIFTRIMNLSNSSKLINFEIKNLGFWDEFKEEVKMKWFVSVRNKNMKM